MTECDEIADTIQHPRFDTFDEAREWLVNKNPDWQEWWSYQQLNNIAESLFKNGENITLNYDNDECNTFVRDMLKVGFDVQDYAGRWFWTGPAVVVDDENGYQTVVLATQIKLQRDNFGLGWIVYPHKSGKLI